MSIPGMALSLLYDSKVLSQNPQNPQNPVAQSASSLTRKVPRNLRNLRENFKLLLLIKFSNAGR